jgi:hypothetical protein
MRAVRRRPDPPFGHDGRMAHAISTEAYRRVPRTVYMPCEGSECSRRVGHDPSAPSCGPKVGSRMGAVAWGLWPTPRFPSPLIKPGVPISGTRLSDWLRTRRRTRLPHGYSFAPRHINLRRRLSMVFAGSSPITTPTKKHRFIVLSAGKAKRT